MRTLTKLCLSWCLLLLFIACQALPESPEPTKPSLGQSILPIIGGKKDSRHPAVGALVGNKRSFCTGTLIASRLVLTAAHCLTSARSQQNRKIKIQFRIEKPNSSPPSFTYHDVDSMISHPQYSSRPNRNDVGVMILKQNIVGVTPIPPNTARMDNTWVRRKILFLGYGVTQTRPRRVGAQYKWGVEIPIRRVASDRFEVFASKQSICSGDSGGPGLYTINGRLYVVGVNSYVQGNSANGQPYCDGSGWDFRVDIYQSWLAPYMSKYGGSCKADSDCGPCFKCDKGKCVLKNTPPQKVACQACKTLQDCGGNGNLCIRRTEGYRCLQPCSKDGCCPTGYSCQQVGLANQMCVPNNNAACVAKCAADKDCGPNETCSGGICKAKPVKVIPNVCKACQKDADCGSGNTCTRFPDGGHCVQPCVNQNFCPSGYSCKNVSGKYLCIHTSNTCPCKSNADCHSGDTCQNGICNKPGGGKYNDPCDSKRKCSAGFSCLQTRSGGRCYQPCKGEYPLGSPGSPCNNGRCPSRHRCFSLSGGTSCLQNCSNASQCTNGGTCQRLGGASFCTCRSDADCKNGTTCNKSTLRSVGVCAKKNTAGSKCPSGFSCQSTGSYQLCLPTPTQNAGDACNNGKSCKPGLVCARGANGYLCIRSCSSDPTCQPEGGRCVTAGSFRYCACAKDADCRPNYQCKKISSTSGVCIPGGAPACKSNADCKNGTVCSGNRCVKPQCTKNSDCVVGQKCENYKCIALTGCRSSADCKANEECKNTKCVPKTGCSTNAECGQGKKCQAGQCVPDTPAEATPSENNTQPEPKEEASTPKDETSAPAEKVAEQTVADAGSKETSGQVDKADPEVSITPNGPCSCSTPGTQPSSSVFFWMLLLLPFIIFRKRNSHF